MQAPRGSGAASYAGEDYDENGIRCTLPQRVNARWPSRQHFNVLSAYGRKTLDAAAGRVGPDGANSTHLFRDELDGDDGAEPRLRSVTPRHVNTERLLQRTANDAARQVVAIGEEFHVREPGCL